MRPDWRTTSRSLLVQCLSALGLVFGVVCASPFAQTSTPELDTLVLTAVRSALTPALPYPQSDEAGELPVDGSTAVPWMVRPTRDGDLAIEVIANPLNSSNQARAAKAMVQIQVAIEAAQKRSQAAYEKAIDDARRTGRSQDFDGITLGDEGVAGARIDAEAHVAIEIAFNRPAYSYTVSSSIKPASLSTPVTGAVAAIGVPANVYRDGRDPATNEHFCAAETHVFLGAVGPPEVHERSNIRFEVNATSAVGPDAVGVRSLVVSLRGNPQLIEQIVRRADWAQLRTFVTGK